MSVSQSSAGLSEPTRAFARIARSPCDSSGGTASAPWPKSQDRRAPEIVRAVLAGTRRARVAAAFAGDPAVNPDPLAP